jgi:hypothetical protein
MTFFFGGGMIGIFEVENGNVKFNFIHTMFSNIKLFYSYNANNECFDFWGSRGVKVVNMDFL